MRGGASSNMYSYNFANSFFFFPSFSPNLSTFFPCVDADSPHPLKLPPDIIWRGCQIQLRGFFFAGGLWLSGVGLTGLWDGIGREGKGRGGEGRKVKGKLGRGKNMFITTVAY